MIIYIDSEYKCHVTDLDGEYRAIETEFFNGKCAAFIEGYRFIPEGETWVNSDGKIITGKKIFPWKPYDELDAAQFDYEMEQIAKYSDALSEIEALIKSARAGGTIETFVDARKQAILTKMGDMFNALYELEVL